MNFTNSLFQNHLINSVSLFCHIFEFWIHSVASFAPLFSVQISFNFPFLSIIKTIWNEWNVNIIFVHLNGKVGYLLLPCYWISQTVTKLWNFKSTNETKNHSVEKINQSKCEIEFFLVECISMSPQYGSKEKASFYFHFFCFCYFFMINGVTYFTMKFSAFACVWNNKMAYNKM